MDTLDTTALGTSYTRRTLWVGAINGYRGCDLFVWWPVLHYSLRINDIWSSASVTSFCALSYRIPDSGVTAKVKRSVVIFYSTRHIRLIWGDMPMPQEAVTFVYHKNIYANRISSRFIPWSPRNIQYPFIRRIVSSVLDPH